MKYWHIQGQTCMIKDYLVKAELKNFVKWNFFSWNGVGETAGDGISGGARERRPHQEVMAVYELLMSLIILDCFTVSLHSPNGRRSACRSGCPRDCQWPQRNYGNSHRFHEATMHCSMPIMHCIYWHPQSIFRLVQSHKQQHQPCLIPNWQSYSQQVRTV